MIIKRKTTTMTRLARACACFGALLAGALLVIACTPKENADIIAGAARDRGLDDSKANVLIGIAACESELQDWRVNAESGATGLFQFIPQTWQLYRDRYFGGAQGDPKNPGDNAQTAAAIVADTGGFAPWELGGTDPYLAYVRGQRPDLPCYCNKALHDAERGHLASATCH